MSGPAAFRARSAVLQSAAWIGIYGLGFLTVLAASLLALLGHAVAGPVSPRPAPDAGDRRRRC